jgi:hypothetical protein
LVSLRGGGVVVSLDPGNGRSGMQGCP